MRKKEAGYYFERIYRVLFYALSISIVLWDKAVPTILVLLMANWIAEANFRQKYQNVRNRFPFTSVFILLYLLYIAGLAYTSNFSYGLTDVLLKLPLFMFPVIVSSFPKSTFNNHTIYTTPVIFTMAVFVAMLLCFINAGFNYQATGAVRQLYYSNLAWFHHPSYLAMYSVFAISVILHRLTGSYSRKSIFYQSFLILSGMSLFVFIIMLSSRAGILALMLTLIITGVFILTEQKKTVKGIVFITAFIALFYTCYRNFPVAFGRLEHTGDVLAAPRLDVDTEDGTAQRILIWEASIDIIKDNLLLGVGTGDVKDELIRAYKLKGMTTTANGNKNAHNQYIQTFVAIGLIGFVMLMLGLLIPGLYAIRQHNLLYFLFLTIIGLNLLFESMLERQAGVMFYAFFNIVLFVLHLQSAVYSKSVETS